MTKDSLLPGTIELNLRRERHRRNWSLTRVSGLTGISATDLSMMERGLRPAYAGWQRRIARAFRMSARELFEPVTQRNPVGGECET